MKVLYISPNGYLGGAEKFLLDINIQHLKNEYIESEILFLNNGECLEVVKDANIKFSLLPFKLRLLSLISLVKCIFYIRKKLKAENINILHCTMPYSLVIGSLAALFLPKVKVVWFQHGPVGGLLDRISMFLPVDLILFNSLYTKASHNLLWGSQLNINKQEVVNLGIPFEKSTGDSSALRNRLLSSREDILIIAAGRICEWKGYEVLISSIKKLKNENDDIYNRIKVIIAGSAKRDNDIKYFNQLKDQVVQNELNNKVEFLGHVDNLREYLYCSDIFVHTSKVPEPFGLVVGEAMLSNCFVIGSDVGGIQDILIDESTGYSYSTSSKNSSDELLAKIKKYLNLSNEKVSKILEESYNHISEDYSVMNMEKQCVDYYKSLGAL